MLAFVFVALIGGILITGCGGGSSSGGGAGVDDTLRWDQGKWDAVKWG